jgi:predicted GTPase
VIGKTGTGKSSLCNAFLIGDTLDKEEKFKTSSDINACTNTTVAHSGKLLGDEGLIQIIDTPGL